MISYFAIDTEVGRAVAGAMLALVMGGVGSAWGISIAAAQGAGVLSEKPGLFGKVILLILLPGTGIVRLRVRLHDCQPDHAHVQLRRCGQGS